MRAIRIHRFGGPKVLQLDEMPVPAPGQGEARVRIQAIGVNFTDVYQRTGRYSGVLPATVGQEAAGTVEAVGGGVSEVKLGDRVAYASVLGSYADCAVVPAWRLVPVPPAVDLGQAAAVLLQGLTAHYLTHSTYPLERDQTVLIHAAAGGVGLLLVQIAKRRGARVIATVSTEEKAALAREMGADAVILYTRVDFETEVQRQTGGKKVDVVYDSVGKDTFEKGLNCLRPRGYMVLFGQSSGPAPALDPQTLNSKGSLFLTRPTLVHYTASREELLQRVSDLFAWVAAGELKVRVDRTFPLLEAAEAHRYLEARKSKGKLLLIP
ncbi:MAG: quinone oxidoreductase [Anaerolineales bacterium]